MKRLTIQRVKEAAKADLEKQTTPYQQCNRPEGFMNGAAWALEETRKEMEEAELVIINEIIDIYTKVNKEPPPQFIMDWFHKKLDNLDID